MQKDLPEGSRVMRFAIARNFLELASSYSETSESFQGTFCDTMSVIIIARRIILSIFVDDIILI